MLGVLTYSSYKKHNNTNEADKIIEISDNCGLKKGDESIRIFRKSRNKKKHYTEYVFKIPLGLEEKDFQERIGKFKDGLNNKSRAKIDLKQIKDINPNENILKQIQDILSHREQLKREVEIEYDGMLKVRVYDQGLEECYLITEEMIKQCKKPWTVPLGVTLHNELMHDFERHSHILIGGATDTGKSTILNLIINVLLYKHPDDVKFTFIDLKGGLEFGAYEHLKQTRNFATNVNEALDALTNAQDEMNEKFELLRKKGKKSVKETNITERHFVIIDEAAEISSDGETDNDVKKIKIKCEGKINDLARRGRASGLKVIYATQYPTTETIKSQTKRNLLTRICLPVDTSTASNVVLDVGGAELLPDVKGRAYYKQRHKQMFQTYLMKDSLIQSIIQPHIRKGGKRASHEVQATATPRSHLANFEEA